MRYMGRNATPRLFWLAGLAILLLLLLSGPAWAARRSRSETCPLAPLPRLTTLDMPDAAAAPLLSSEDLQSIAPPGFTLESGPGNPDEFALGGGLCLNADASSLLVRLAVGPARESAGLFFYGSDGRFWNEAQKVYPAYQCKISLRSSPRDAREVLLQSFDTAAHNAFVRALESPLPRRGQPEMASGLRADLNVCSSDKLSRGREFLAWDEWCGAGVEGRHASERRGELQAVIRIGGKHYLLCLGFSAEGCCNDLALTRNIAACLASRLAGSSYEPWTYLAETPLEPGWAASAVDMPVETAPRTMDVPSLEALFGSAATGAPAPRTEDSLDPDELEGSMEAEQAAQSSGEQWTSPSSGEQWTEPTSGELWAER